MFNGNHLTHDLLLTTTQKTKLRNAFNNNISTDLKLLKAEISKIIQSGGSFIFRIIIMVHLLAGPLIKAAIPLAKNVLAASAIALAIEKNTGFWNNNFNNFKWRNEWYNENCTSSWVF